MQKRTHITRIEKKAMTNMKRLLYILLLSLPTYSFAQTVNGIPIKDINVEYVQIVGTSKMLSTKLSIDIDFGQENSYWTQKDTQLRDANNKMISFNSMIDALNFMTSNGYEFVQAFAISTQNNQSVYHYLLRKRKL